jgi:hypothetical protein
MAAPTEAHADGWQRWNSFVSRLSMRRVADGLYQVVVTLWVGGLWAIGYVAAPVLFANLSGNRMLAGTLAGNLFTVGAYVAIGCAAYALIYLLAQRGTGALRMATFWIVVVMLLLTLAGHFGIQPILAQLKAQVFPHNVMQSIMRDRFAAWHGVSSVLYLIQSLLGLVLVLRKAR